MGAKPLRDQDDQDKNATGARDGSGLRRANGRSADVADELDVDESELLDTAKFAALTAEEEARGIAEAKRVTAARTPPRPSASGAAMTVRVSDAEASRATVKAPEAVREELRALRRETLDRIAAEKRASRSDLDDLAATPLETLEGGETVRDAAAPRPVDAPFDDGPAAIVAVVAKAKRSSDGANPVAAPSKAPVVAKGPLPKANPPPRAKEREDEASSAKTQPLAKLRQPRPDAKPPLPRGEASGDPGPKASEDVLSSAKTLPLKKLRQERPAATKPTPAPAAKGTPWGKIVGVAMVAVATFVVGRMIRDDATPPPEPASLSEGPVQSPQPPPPAEAPPARVDPEPSAPTEAEPAAATSAPAPSEVAPSRTAEAKVPPVPVTPTAKPTAGASASSPPADATPTQGLDASAAQAALARAGAKAASCTDPKGGRGPMSVTFSPDGSVSSAKMGGPYEGTAVANCVQQIFRAIRVTPFEGAPATVFYSVTLPGDGKTAQ